jgi:hypothetical protein
MSKEGSGRVFDLLEKVLVPLILALLVFTNQQAQVRISRAQTKLAEEQAKMAAIQGEQGFNIECVKLFFNDICGSDPKRQRMAMALLALLNDSLAKPLADGVAQDSSAVSRPVLEAARAVQVDIGARELRMYKVVIYCPKDNETYMRDAELIRDSLLSHIVAESVVVRRVEWSWFVDHRYSDGYQIRYEADTESGVARYLKSLLESVKPGREFRLETIVGRTPQFISVLVAGAPAGYVPSTSPGTEPEY